MTLVLSAHQHTEDKGIAVTNTNLVIASSRCNFPNLRNYYTESTKNNTNPASNSPSPVIVAPCLKSN